MYLEKNKHIVRRLRAKGEFSQKGLMNKGPAPLSSTFRCHKKLTPFRMTTGLSLECIDFL